MSAKKQTIAACAAFAFLGAASRRAPRRRRSGLTSEFPADLNTDCRVQHRRRRNLDVMRASGKPIEQVGRPTESRSEYRRSPMRLEPAAQTPLAAWRAHARNSSRSFC
jgi:hypothetical protein